MYQREGTAGANLAHSVRMRPVRLKVRSKG